MLLGLGRRVMQRLGCHADVLVMPSGLPPSTAVYTCPSVHQNVERRGTVMERPTTAAEVHHFSAAAMRDVAAAAVPYTELAVVDRMPDRAAAGLGHSASAAAPAACRARAVADPYPTRHGYRGSVGRC